MRVKRHGGTASSFTYHARLAERESARWHAAPSSMLVGQRKLYKDRAVSKVRAHIATRPSEIGYRTMFVVVLYDDAGTQLAEICNLKIERARGWRQGPEDPSRGVGPLRP